MSNTTEYEKGSASYLTPAAEQNINPYLPHFSDCINSHRDVGHIYIFIQYSICTVYMYLPEVTSYIQQSTVG